jgi:hypothetical protein
LLGAEAAGNALDGFDIILVIVYAGIGAKADAGQATDAQFLVETDDAGFVTGQGVGGADVDALSALGADCHCPLGIAQATDADRGLGLVDLFVPGVGANILAKVAANTQLVVGDQNFHRSFSLFSWWYNKTPSPGWRERLEASTQGLKLGALYTKNQAGSNGGVLRTDARDIFIQVQYRDSGGEAACRRHEVGSCDSNMAILSLFLFYYTIDPGLV